MALVLPEEERTEDYYEVLQVSASAEPDTINRVFRMLAQRYHPDNQQTGNEKRFRTIRQAYRILNDRESRARYDVVHEQQRKDRWPLWRPALKLRTTSRWSRSCGLPCSRLSTPSAV